MNAIQTKHKRAIKKYQMQQLTFENLSYKNRFSYGGTLRKKRTGRNSRPLSTKGAIHLVFKADKLSLKNGLRSFKGFQICHRVIKTYAKKFHIKIIEMAICADHIHLLVKLTRRSWGQHFFRVVAGQIAQKFQINHLLVTDTPQEKKEISKLFNKEDKKTDVKTISFKKLWLYRPFTRVVLGWKAYVIAREYVRLNEKEAQGLIAYRKDRLRGLKIGIGHFI